IMWSRLLLLAIAPQLVCASEGQTSTWLQVMVGESRLITSITQQFVDVRSKVQCGGACTQVAWCSVWCMKSSTSCLLTNMVLQKGYQDTTGTTLMACYTNRTKDLALDTTITGIGQCSWRPTRIASNIIDGIHTRNSDNCVCLDTRDKPWVLVNLGAVHSITTVSLIADTSDPWAGYYLKNFEVRVGLQSPSSAGDFSSYQLLGSVSRAAVAHEEFVLTADTPLNGQFVSVQIMESALMEFCHLEIR
ncbi:unnamed protein product, partial [Meganyctiphanes norvegica]